MISQDRVIKDMLYGNIVERLAEEMQISIDEARLRLSEMSFANYHKLVSEASVITPPSGNTIAPSGPSTSPQKPGTATSKPSNIKSIWPGQGAPVEVGMTVGLKGPNGTPAPGTVSQVDQAAKGVKIKNPTTGQDEWVNIDTLEPFMNDQQSPSQPNSVQEELNRIRVLAGLAENCSAGATSAGAIAAGPVASAPLKRRQETNEEPKKEYTPKGPAKTIAGDTKPNQASGELSANLAARGKKTASRINNGFKK